MPVGSERFITYIASEEDDLGSIIGEGDLKVEEIIAGDQEITAEIRNEGSKLPVDTAEEENKLQIVTVKYGGGKEGANLGKMLSRYMKAFAHVVKLKKGHHLASSRKKKVLQLPML